MYIYLYFIRKPFKICYFDSKKICRNNTVRGSWYTRRDSVVNIQEGKGMGNHTTWALGRSLGCCTQGTRRRRSTWELLPPFKEQHLEGTCQASGMRVMAQECFWKLSLPRDRRGGLKSLYMTSPRVSVEQLNDSYCSWFHWVRGFWHPFQMFPRVPWLTISVHIFVGEAGRPMCWKSIEQNLWMCGKK